MTSPSTTLLTREALGPVPMPVTPTATGWRTPEAYVNCRTVGLSPGATRERLEELLVPELAGVLGVPVECVSLRSQMSWVDPQGRLVFWLEARKPVAKALENGATIDL